MSNKFWFEGKNINCFKNDFRVIKDLNLKIAYSENVILIGPNGSGKSSLIEIINRNIYPVIADESKLKIFNKELINIWELRKRISTVNNDIKNRINPNLQVFDLILSGLYGKYCFISDRSERDHYKVENIRSTISRQIRDLAEKAKWPKILWKSRIQAVPAFRNNFCKKYTV